VSRRRYWILFASTQIVGLLAWWFANVHTTPFQMLFGLALLFPGSLVVFVPHIQDLVGLPLAVLINVGAWYLIRKNRPVNSE